MEGLVSMGATSVGCSNLDSNYGQYTDGTKNILVAADKDMRVVRLK